MNVLDTRECTDKKSHLFKHVGQKPGQFENLEERERAKILVWCRQTASSLLPRDADWNGDRYAVYSKEFPKWVMIVECVKHPNYRFITIGPRTANPIRRMLQH